MGHAFQERRVVFHLESVVCVCYVNVDTCMVCLQELSRRLTAAMKEAHGKSVAGERQHPRGGGGVGEFEQA